MDADFFLYSQSTHKKAHLCPSTVLNKSKPEQELYKPV